MRESRQTEAHCLPRRSEEVDKLVLFIVRVLILVDKNERIRTRVRGAQHRVPAENIERQVKETTERDTAILLLEARVFRSPERRRVPRTLRQRRTILSMSHVGLAMIRRWTVGPSAISGSSMAKMTFCFRSAISVSSASTSKRCAGERLRLVRTSQRHPDALRQLAVSITRSHLSGRRSTATAALRMCMATRLPTEVCTTYSDLLPIYSRSTPDPLPIYSRSTLDLLRIYSDLSLRRYRDRYRDSSALVDLLAVPVA